MRPRFPLLFPVLACLSLPATAIATTRCSGLSVTAPAGSHTVVSSPDGRALHMQLAGDGSDAASVALSHLSGATLRCTQPWPSSSPMTLSLDFITAASQVTATADAHVDLQHSSTGVIDVTVDVSSMCSSGTCSNLYRVCYSVDGLVWQEQATASSSFTLSAAPGGSASIPSVSMEMDSEHTREILAMQFDSAVEYHTPTGTVLVDRVVTVMEMASPDGDPIPDIDRCVISCPVTGGASSLDFSSLSCVTDGVTLTAADVNLDGQPELVRLDASSSTTAMSVTTTATWSRMVFGGGGSGGCASGQCSPLSVLDRSCPATTMQLSRKDMLQWFAAPDQGAQCDFTIQAKDQFGNAQVASSLECRMVGPSVVVSSSMRGQPADSVRVLSHGSEVGRFAICAACGSSVSVSAPPGGPPVMAFAAMGAVHGGWDLKSGTKVIVAGDRMGEASSSTATTCTLGMMVGFGDPRVFDVGGGVSVTGDELQFKSACSGGGNALTIYGSNFSMQRSGTPSPASSVLEVTDFSASHADQVVASVVGPPALSNSNPTVDVALDLQREDHSAARGLSVSVQLSPNLVLLGDDEMPVFSSHGQTEHFRTFDGLSYTLDVAILGPGCGPTDDGRAFMLHVARAPGAPDGLGFVTVTHTELASCSGPPLPCAAGSKTAIVLDSSTPAAATTLTAQTLQTGNDADGTAKIVLDWTLTDPSSQSIELYRAPYGDYPRYASGSSPALPASYPPPAPWTPVTLSCSSGAVGTPSACTDEPSSRDCYTYSAVVVSRSGNRSPFVMTPACALDYHLGDVTDGVTQCSGDNQVTTADVSALGSHYGAGVPLGSPFDCLDVGPTLDRTVSSRPVPDHKLSFADLILYAIDFSLVSTPAGAPRPLAAAANAVSLDVPRLPAMGQTFAVALRMSGAGDVQGLSATLAYDPAVVEQVGVSEGDLVARQGRAGVVLSSGPGDVDAALLGAGPGFAGEGELARVTFRVKAAGDPALALGGIVARDLQNRDVTIGGSGPGTFTGTTALRMAFPNPFARTTTVVLSLHETGPADVSVYDVAGRHVRSLLHGVQPAGEHTLAWDGSDDGGGRLGPGVYMLRLDAGGHRETRVLRLVK